MKYITSLFPVLIVSLFFFSECKPKPVVKGQPFYYKPYQWLNRKPIIVVYPSENDFKRITDSIIQAHTVERKKQQRIRDSIAESVIRYDTINYKEYESNPLKYL